MYIDCIHACMYYLYTQSVFMLIPRKNEFREEEPAAAADSLGGGGMSPGGTSEAYKRGRIKQQKYNDFGFGGIKQPF